MSFLALEKLTKGKYRVTPDDGRHMLASFGLPLSFSSSPQFQRRAPQTTTVIVSRHLSESSGQASVSVDSLSRPDLMRLANTSDVSPEQRLRLARELFTETTGEIPNWPSAPAATAPARASAVPAPTSTSRAAPPHANDAQRAPSKRRRLAAPQCNASPHAQSALLSFARPLQSYPVPQTLVPHVGGVHVGHWPDSLSSLGQTVHIPQAIGVRSDAPAATSQAAPEPSGIWQESIDTYSHNEPLGQFRCEQQQQQQRQRQRQQQPPQQPARAQPKNSVRRKRKSVSQQGASAASPPAPARQRSAPFVGKAGCGHYISANPTKGSKDRRYNRKRDMCSYCARNEQRKEKTAARHRFERDDDGNSPA